MTTQTRDVNLSTAACSALILVCIIWRTPEHKDVRPCSKTSQTDIYKKNADNEGCFCFLTFHSVQCYSFSPSQDIYVNLGFRLVSCLHLVSIISTKHFLYFYCTLHNRKVYLPETRSQLPEPVSPHVWLPPRWQRGEKKNNYILLYITNEYSL